jgi:alkaline phosphatase
MPGLLRGGILAVPFESHTILTSSFWTSGNAGERAAMRSAKAILFMFVALSLAWTNRTQTQNGDRTADVRRALEDGGARNVLVFIGDGMGDSEITLARNYEVGAAGRLAMDSLPFTGEYTTYAVKEDAPEIPDYVTDSAASGTGWSTGVKTSNGRISTSARTDRDLKTILEIARDRGYRTGDITTAELTDATPAVLGAHVANRSCQGPSDMAACPQDRKSAGGPGSIAEQLIAHHVDVLLGGGASRFAQATEEGPTVADAARTSGYQVVATASELESAKAPVLGLFASGNMSLEWNGAEALPYPSNVANPQTCTESVRPTNEPSLAAMTTKAITLLDRPGTNAGFFLQVEGASIDKQSHAASPCTQIGETIAFDQAIRVGLEFARTHPRTLLIVTGDHGHAGQIVGMPNDTDHPSGLLSALRTKEGGTLVISYATNGYHRSQDHTGTEIRVAAMGPQAANVLGVINQTDLFSIMSRAIQEPVLFTEAR